jgi:RimJ/RimL family protein N-acetyltransferase
MPTLTLIPFTSDLARAMLAGERRHGWAAGFPTPGDLEVAGRIVDGRWVCPSSDEPWGAWVLIEPETGLAVGGAGFHGPPSADGSVEIGYGVAADCQGRGLATTAVLALIDIAAAHGASSLVAATDVDNLASSRVLEKCGFTRGEAADGEIRWSRALLTESRA